MLQTGNPNIPQHSIPDELLLPLADLSYPNANVKQVMINMNKPTRKKKKKKNQILGHHENLNEFQTVQILYSTFSNHN